VHTTNNPGAVAHPTFIKPLQGRRSPRNQYACWQACLVLPNRDFQQETCNTAIVLKLSCAHSWWSRQSQYCPVTRFRDAGMPSFDRCTHFHIPIWLAFRGYNRTICEIGRSGMWGGGGETPRLPAGPHETERALQSRLGWSLVISNAIPLNI
jgi:hypothetical protein